MIRGGLLLGAGNVSAAVLSLLRNVLIARLIGVEDFGIASTLAIAVSVVEATSHIAFDRLIVQARDGDDPVLMSTAHAILAVRGLVAAIVLFVAAGQIAYLFGLPEIAWAYQALALVPLMRGLAHLDLYRRQREMRFLPFVAVEGTAQFVATVAAVPLALAFGDFRVMLFCLLIQQLAFTAGSHIVAARSYRWAWDGAIVRRAISFGWPILLNSILMLGMFHGDRVIVGSLIGMAELGWYSAVFMLTLIPVKIVAGTLGSWFLPQLAHAQEDERAFVDLYRITAQAYLFAAIVLIVSVATIGPAIFINLYGAQYEEGLSVFVWVAIMQGVRIARSGLATVSEARARTTNQLFGNVARVSVLPVAWGLVAMGAGVPEVVAVGIAGEILAYIVSLLLLRQRLGLPLAGLALPLAASAGVIALVFLEAPIRLSIAPGSQDALGAQVIILAALVLAFWSMRAFRHWGSALLARTRESHRTAGPNVAKP